MAAGEAEDHDGRKFAFLIDHGVVSAAGKFQTQGEEKLMKTVDQEKPKVEMWEAASAAEMTLAMLRAT